MSDQSTTHYNPNRQGKAFNEDAGAKIWYDTISPITDEDNQQAQDALDALIAETKRNLL